MAEAQPGPQRGSVAGDGDESWREAWRRWNAIKPVSAYERESKASKLTKALGARDLTVLGVSAIIGAGIFTLPGVAVGLAGPGMILGFAVAGFVCAFAALNYAELASMLPISGSAYAYSYATVGELLGWLVGWNLVLEYALGNVAVAVAWGDNLAGLLAGLGLALPFYLTAAPGVVDSVTGATGIFHLPAFVIVLLVMLILLRGVRESAKTATGIVAVKLFVLLFVIFFGAFYLNPANFNPFLPLGVFGVMGSAAIVFFAYIGFDAVSTAAEETRNPARDLPLGILASLVICTVLYMLVSTVLVGICPYTSWVGAGDAAQESFRCAGLGNASLLIGVGAIVGITGVLLVFALGMPRIFLTMARDGLLPRKMAEVHPTYHTPYFTTVMASLIVAVLAGVTPLASAANLVNIGTLFAFIVVSFAVILLRRRLPDAKRPFRVPFSPWVPLFGIVLMLALVFSLDTITLIRFVAWSGVGVMIYGFYGARRSRLSGEGPRKVLLEEHGRGGRGRAKTARRD